MDNPARHDGAEDGPEEDGRRHPVGPWAVSLRTLLPRSMRRTYRRRWTRPNTRGIGLMRHRCLLVAPCTWPVASGPRPPRPRRSGRTQSPRVEGARRSCGIVGESRISTPGMDTTCSSPRASAWRGTDSSSSSSGGARPPGRSPRSWGRGPCRATRGAPAEVPGRHDPRAGPLPPPRGRDRSRLRRGRQCLHRAPSESRDRSRSSSSSSGSSRGPGRPRWSSPATTASSGT